jgi:hypothetical protein
VPHELVHELLADLAPRFRQQDYSLLFHNCNHFSNELALLLTGEAIPVSRGPGGRPAGALLAPACARPRARSTLGCAAKPTQARPSRLTRRPRRSTS